jgi:hypothetical protein
MDPNNPWTPPIITAGDVDLEGLYAAIGRTLSSWEILEANLALLFAYIVEPVEGSNPARRAYGKITTFRGRMEALMAAAEASLPTAKPDVYAQLDSLVRALRGAPSQRRNDIAHGAVQMFSTFGAQSWALYPAWYNTSKRSLENRPNYIYGTAEIREFGRLYNEFIERVWPIVDGVRSR